MTISGESHRAGYKTAQGVIYSERVLQEAVDKYKAKSYRLLTLGAPQEKLRLRAVVGTVESIELIKGNVHVRAQIIATPEIYSRVQRYERKWGKIAFACLGEGNVDGKTVSNYEIQGVSVVPLRAFYEEMSKDEIESK